MKTLFNNIKDNHFDNIDYLFFVSEQNYGYAYQEYAKIINSIYSVEHPIMGAGELPLYPPLRFKYEDFRV